MPGCAAQPEADGDLSPRFARALWRLDPDVRFFGVMRTRNNFQRPPEGVGIAPETAWELAERCLRRPRFTLLIAEAGGLGDKTWSERVNVRGFGTEPPRLVRPFWLREEQDTGRPWFVQSHVGAGFGKGTI
jgi:hypothetical protein